MKTNKDKIKKTTTLIIFCIGVCIGFIVFMMGLFFSSSVVFNYNPIIFRINEFISFNFGVILIFIGLVGMIVSMYFIVKHKILIDLLIKYSEPYYNTNNVIKEVLEEITKDTIDVVLFKMEEKAKDKIKQIKDKK